MYEMDILLLGSLIAVRQMTAMRQIETHETIMWSHQGLVNLQVGWAAAQALHVDAPLLGVNVEGLKGSLLA
jgi:hypothetical protein